ncbi:MAG: hypothetical protein OEY07_02900 [Gammaproteobacteria bacterium]|nr:hypothetical protein [Gammaproteobacteria bacterium]
MTTHGITPLGRHWRALLYVLNICRFSLIVLGAVGAMLNIGQGQDLLIGVAEDNRYLLLLCSTTLWAFSLWLWTRTLLEIRFPDTGVDQELLVVYRRWLPRVMAMLAYVIVAVAAKNAGGHAGLFFLPTLVVGVMFCIILIKRRPVSRWAAAKLSAQSDQHWLHVDEMHHDKALFADWREASTTKLGKLAAAFLIMGLCMFLWGTVSPESLGTLLNAQMLLMLWGAGFLPIGSAITYFGNKTGIPVVTVLVGAMLLFSLWNDNHAIRPMPGNTTPADRLTLKQGLDEWRKVNCVNGKCKPFVIVATAGGGIRAAYWTGTVLGHIYEERPVFKDRLFAISAVSGGAVGSTVFRSVLAAEQQGPCKGKVLECTQRILTKDFLSPLTASLLYPDILQWFLPVPMLRDRAVTLENAFAKSYRDVTQQDTLNESFSNISRQGRPWPALFFNSTWVENGRFIVAGSLIPGKAKAFWLYRDQLDEFGYDVRLISAAHNSARAPYVSPSGSWFAGKGKDKTAGAIKGRLTDGGLYDTFGASTAIELFNFAREELKDQFRPLVIQISSTPNMPKDLSETPPLPVSNFGYEFLTMFNAIYATSDGHAKVLASQLKQLAEKHGSYAYFRMCDPADKEVMPPFGWSLSEHARVTLQSFLLNKDVQTGQTLPKTSCTAENQAAAAQVIKVLAD